MLGLLAIGQTSTKVFFCIKPYCFALASHPNSLLIIILFKPFTLSNIEYSICISAWPQNILIKSKQTSMKFFFNCFG